MIYCQSFLSYKEECLGFKWDLGLLRSCLASLISSICCSFPWLYIRSFLYDCVLKLSAHKAFASSKFSSSKSGENVHLQREKHSYVHAWQVEQKAFWNNSHPNLWQGHLSKHHEVSKCCGKHHALLISQWLQTWDNTQQFFFCIYYSFMQMKRHSCNMMRRQGM